MYSLACQRSVKAKKAHEYPSPLPSTNIDEVIKEFTPAIKYLAYRLTIRRPTSLGANDLVSAGMIGLMDAFEKYNPDRQAKFKTYAEFRIRGAMLDEIREMDWAPRSIREKYAQLRRVLVQLQDQLGRPPREEELADAMGITVENVLDLLAQPSRDAVLSIDGLDADEVPRKDLMEALVDTSSPDPLSAVVSKEVQSILTQAIDELPGKQRLTLTLYYYEELTMKKIGAVLGVSESRVCQLHQQAVLSLKASLARTLHPAGSGSIQ